MIPNGRGWLRWRSTPVARGFLCGRERHRRAPRIGGPLADRYASCRACKTSAGSATPMCLSRKRPFRMDASVRSSSSRPHRRRHPRRARLLIAREYGQPGRRGPGDATVRLHLGQLSTVDGSAGTVIPHTDPSPISSRGQCLKSDRSDNGSGMPIFGVSLPQGCVRPLKKLGAVTHLSQHRSGHARLRGHEARVRRFRGISSLVALRGAA